jgi:hypothetical protein
MHRRFLSAVLLLASPAAFGADAPAAPPLSGKIAGHDYVSPTGAFSVEIPVLPELGGTVTDTANVVTFEDNFTVHISIAAFDQDATQRWELTTRGPKEYLIYFFTTFVLPDFLQRFPGTTVEDSARFIPALNNGTLLAFTLLPGGSMFADRAAVPGSDPKSIVAKRGNLLFVKAGHIFVISTELAEHVLERSLAKHTMEEENELLRQRLLGIVQKMEFPAANPPADKGAGVSRDTKG